MNDTVDKQSSRGYWVQSLGCLPTEWVGGAVVTSDYDIVAVGRPHVGNQVLTYTGFSSGAQTNYVPMLFKNIWGYQSAFYVQNVDDTLDAEITIEFYDTTGNLSCTFDDTISPNASHGYWLASLGCLPTEWVGGVVVTSTTDIVSIGRPHMDKEVTAYNGFQGGSTTAYAPMMYIDTAQSYNTALYVQNIDPANPADVTLKFYDTGGNLTCIVTDTIQPLSSNGYWLPSVTCDP